MVLNKPWQPFDPQHPPRLPGALGVFEIGNDAGEVIMIGFAGGRSRYGLRSEISARFDGTAPNEGFEGQARSYRYEVNMMYMTRYVELLEKHLDATGALPPGNRTNSVYVPNIVKRRGPRRAG